MSIRCFLLLSFLLSASLSSLAQDPIPISDWKMIRTMDKRASIFSPDDMTVRIDSIETDIGKVITVHHVLQQPTDFSPNFLFHLSYSIYPEGVISLDSTEIVEDLLATTVENTVLMQNGELLYSATRNYKDYPGRIWKTKYGEGAYVMKSCGFVTDDRLYIVQVGSLADTPTGDAVDHFLDSFKINAPSGLKE